MAEGLRRGDRVEWNFRGHVVAGRVVRKLTRRAEVDGRAVAASKEDPRYVVRSDKSGRQTVRRAEKLGRVTR
jgi:Hypervirulence associated proteins TUDOR domain